MDYKIRTYSVKNRGCYLFKISFHINYEIIKLFCRQKLCNTVDLLEIKINKFGSSFMNKNYDERGSLLRQKLRKYGVTLLMKITKSRSHFYDRNCENQKFSTDRIYNAERWMKTIYITSFSAPISIQVHEKGKYQQQENVLDRKYKVYSE